MDLMHNQTFKLLQDSSEGAYPAGIYRVIFDDHAIAKTPCVCIERFESVNVVRGGRQKLTKTKNVRRNRQCSRMDSKDDPLAPLHSLLEPSTATQVRDASMNFEFDASLITWIATANHVMFIPSSLRSRFREFRIDYPNAEQAITLAFSVAASVIEKTAPPNFSPVKREVVLKIAHLTAREIFQVVEEAIGKAALNHRTKIELSDLPVELIRLDADSSSEHSARKGYLH